MPDPSPYPDLDLDIVGEIYNAVHRELLAEAGTGQALEPVFENGTAEPRIYTCDSIPVALDDGTLTTAVPTLLIAPGPVEEKRIGNADYTELKTGVDLGLLTGISSPINSNDWLRARIFRAVKRRLMREHGTLRDGAGGPTDNPLTDALQGFGRIEPSGRLRARTSVLLTTFRITFVSAIDGLTGEHIG